VINQRTEPQIVLVGYSSTDEKIQEDQLRTRRSDLSRVCLCLRDLSGFDFLWSDITVLYLVDRESAQRLKEFFQRAYQRGRLDAQADVRSALGLDL
jgi:hypothetical protein